MKILIISDLYPILDDLSIPFVLEDFARAFMKFGADVSVIRANFILNSIIRKHRLVKSGVYKRNDVKIYNRNFFFPFLFEKTSFIKKIKEENFDVIISHMPSGHLYCALINKKLNLKHIAIAHYSDYRVLGELKYFLFKSPLKKAYYGADIRGARNNFLKNKLNASFLLPSFIDKKFILKKKEKPHSSKLKLITLSKLIKRKNINLVVEALAKVNLNNDFDFEYDIFGGGKEEKSLKNLIKQHNLEDKITIHPYLNHDLIFNKLDNKDIFILPSINETFGLSYLEALARGLIVVSAKNSGADGIIENCKDGFIVDPSAGKIYDTLRKISALDITDREKISQNALLKIKEYEKEKIMKKYFEIIKKIL